MSLLKVGHLAKGLAALATPDVTSLPVCHRVLIVIVHDISSNGLAWMNNSIYPQKRTCTVYWNNTINPTISAFDDEAQALCKDLSVDTRLCGGYDPRRPSYPDPSIVSQDPDRRPHIIFDFADTRK